MIFLIRSDFFPPSVANNYYFFSYIASKLGVKPNQPKDIYIEFIYLDWFLIKDQHY